MKKFHLIVINIIFLVNFSASQSDTILYYNFTDSIPPNWQVYDSTGNNFNWIHTYTGLNAAYTSQSTSHLNSSSNQNGWLMFHAAYYNTDTTGGLMNPITPAIYMNSTITSGKMNFSSEANVFLSLEHFYYTLSSPTWGSLELGVSNDSISWTIFDLHTGSDSPANLQNGVEKLSLDISSIAANQPQVWIRFHFRNLRWYFWNIDDLLFSRSNILSVTQNNNDNYVKLNPNPVKNNLTIELNLKEESNVEITVLDLLGNIVSTIVETRMNLGINKLEWNVSKIPNGIYLINVKSNNTMNVKKVIVSK